MLTIDQKWEHIKVFYERTYRSAGFKFKSRPNNILIQDLWIQMKNLERTLREFYEDHPYLGDNLKKLRGQLQDLTKKRQYFE